MTKPGPAEATTPGEVHKWFQQLNGATSLQEIQILQVTQRISYFTSCCRMRGTKTLHQPQRKGLLPLFQKREGAQRCPWYNTGCSSQPCNWHSSAWARFMPCPLLKQFNLPKLESPKGKWGNDTACIIARCLCRTLFWYSELRAVRNTASRWQAGMDLWKVTQIQLHKFCPALTIPIFINR